MPNRILREGINASPRVNKLSMGAEILYRRLLSVVDDYGRFYASPATVRGACWPTCPEKVCEQDVDNWLAECEQVANILRTYSAKGCRYLQVLDFNQKIRSKSKFPEPADILQTDCQQVVDKTPALVGGVVRSRSAESKAESGLRSQFSQFIENWTKPNEEGKVFTCADVDLGLQVWISLIDKGTITTANVDEIFAGLERHRQSKKWRDGYVLSVPAFLGWAKNGVPAAPRWNDRPEPVSVEENY